MYNEGNTLNNGRPVLANCVEFGNGGSNAFYNYDATTLFSTYSLFEQSSVMLTGIAQSGPGNLTTVSSPFATTANVALAMCSPAIDAGNPNSVLVASGPYSTTALPFSDLLGNPRIISGKVDMGAIEFQLANTFNIVTIRAGHWNDPATWSCGRVPSTGDAVRVGHVVTIPAGYTAWATRIGFTTTGQLVYQAGAHLSLRK